ncbi:MAG: uroporphyrinogen decarboxylase family protein [Candidatus Sifarchaeia archaeon]
MNPLERFYAALKFKKADRIPFIYQFFGAATHVLKAIHKSFKEVYYTPEGVVAFQLKAQELYGHDNIMIPGGCLTVEAEAMGAENLKMLNLMSADPYQDGRMPVYIEAIRLISDKLGETTPIIGTILTPLGVLMELIGFAQVFKGIKRNPEIIHEALRVVTQTCSSYVSAMLKEGAHGILIEEAGASASLMRREICDEFGLQYTKTLISVVKSAGGASIIHNCSEEPYIDLQVSAHPDVLNVSGGDLKSIKKQFGNQVCLMGNIEPAVIHLGSPKEVRSKAIECINEWKNEGGFIFSTGCEIPHNAPITNVKILKEVVEQYGRY